MSMTFQKGHTIFQGRKHSDETRAKISAANKGRIFTDEWLKNLSEAHKGQVSHRKGKVFVPLEVQEQKRKARLKVWKEKNRDKLREQDRVYKEANKDRLAELRRTRYKKDPQKQLDYVRFRKYGISGDEFRAIVAKQNHQCPICLRNIDKNFSVDHEHTTGKIRGIICNDCNLAMGNAGESSARLRAMADYLDKT